MKILVIGDSCIDRFIYCDINRICPEAPVPVLQPMHETENPGMAANVVSNLESLGAEVHLITNETDMIKTRYVDDKSGQMIMRLDENDECNPIDFHQDWQNCIDMDFDLNYDAIVISDYCKGFLTLYDIAYIGKKANCPTFLDTKKKLGDWCHDIDFVKVNKPEWLSQDGYKHDNVIVTDGKDGAVYKDKIYPVKEKVKVSDVSGAGDTFIASLVFEYTKSTSIEKAIKFANKCASKVVQQRGVTTI
tara:strand:+ start:1160 stop:1900 length:741 start_codon:yes stop_codon:yes gene_type:complete